MRYCDTNGYEWMGNIYFDVVVVTFDVVSVILTLVLSIFDVVTDYSANKMVTMLGI
ncbi:hypothetical protein RhiirA1_428965 [Rhizophagus irregularis]|uniref:Uncharacterized protein n=1 Tax=Rhizophagus irregularis TaxID=588596 RepID=A0A2N0R095_9GLOM|nr:hypothetical protein RhiirA1_428965 [Rhizophagus irregularis]